MTDTLGSCLAGSMSWCVIIYIHIQYIYCIYIYKFALYFIYFFMYVSSVNGYMSCMVNWLVTRNILALTMTWNWHIFAVYRLNTNIKDQILFLSTLLYMLFCPHLSFYFLYTKMFCCCFSFLLFCHIFYIWVFSLSIVLLH